MSASIHIRRLYDEPAAGPGYRVFIDRLWPRGVAREAFSFDCWSKTLAPTPDLRRWFDHKPANWPGFCEKYRGELRSPEQQQAMSALLDEAGKQDIVLLYGARDTRHNHAIVLAEELQRLRDSRQMQT
ncbi:MAG: DUF488 family protein [Castellaniella sp.]